MRRVWIRGALVAWALVACAAATAADAGEDDAFAPGALGGVKVGASGQAYAWQPGGC